MHPVSNICMISFAPQCLHIYRCIGTVTGIPWSMRCIMHMSTLHMHMPYMHAATPGRRRRHRDRDVTTDLRVRLGAEV